MTRPKANHGDGGVSRKPRADGRYAATLVIEGVRYYRYARTRAEAQKALARLKEARDLNMPVNPERVTLGEYLTEWLETSRSGQAVQTQAIYRRTVTQKIVPSLGRVKLVQLTAAHLRRLYGDLGQTLAPGSIAIVHGVLHLALRQATRDGVLARNVADLVTPPAVPRFAASPLTAVQARAFLDAAQGDALEALWLLMLTTGARIGELLAVRWSAIDYERRTLEIAGSLLQRPVDGVYTSAGKGSRKRRNGRPVQLTAATVRALQQRRAAQAAERLLAGHLWRETGDWVFTTSVGSPLKYSDVRARHFRPLLARAGIPPCRPHDLRHSVATLLLSEGVHPTVVSHLLGHSTTAMTTDRYSHVSPTLQGQASDVLERLLGG